MNTQPQEEPARRHLSFCTLGVFTSRARAAACLASRGVPGGQAGVLPVTLNAPLRPCLGSAVMSARQTRLLVRASTSPPPLLCTALPNVNRSTQYGRV